MGLARVAGHRDVAQGTAQPIVDIMSGAVVGAEALVRWDHPSRGLVQPEDFIPLAEHSGLVHSIGVWVIYDACRRVAEWRDNILPEASSFTMSVNISALQLDDEGFAAKVAAILRAFDFDPSWLVLELTEGAMMHAPAGYSSLAYFHTLPLDVVKFDRAGIETLNDPGQGGMIATGVVRYAHLLGLITIAEGVTDTGQLETLRNLGCEWGQGFLFGAAASAAHMESRLRPATVVKPPSSPEKWAVNH
jgi:EAL domain-containing protein (putative c-di-GMP-specific phosphodiesterase class I)